MTSRPLLALAFATLVACAAYRSIEAAPPAAASLAESIASLRDASRPEQTGTFPEKWIDGVDASEPRWQIHAYNEDLYILRQSKRMTFEAPFLFLLFGEEKALLLDTGAKQGLDVYATVNKVIEHWLRRHGKESIPLIVAHTHSHIDHVQGDPSFVGKPGVETIVGLGVSDVTEYWGFQDFPKDMVTMDLGNRVLDVLGSPGHQAASISVYDRMTHLLLTGDIVYPGHLFVFSPLDWPVFVASLRRLATFAATHPVEWVLGCHIEMGAVPGQSFAWGTEQHPNEHVLQLPPSILTTILGAAQAMGNTPSCTIFDEFVIHPVYLCGITWNG